MLNVKTEYSSQNTKNRMQYAGAIVRLVYFYPKKFLINQKHVLNYAIYLFICIKCL